MAERAPRPAAADPDEAALLARRRDSPPMGIARIPVDPIWFGRSRSSTARVTETRTAATASEITRWDHLREEAWMLTCRELVEFLMAYLDDELSLGQRARIRLHLAFCADCRRYVASYAAAVRLGKQALAPSEDPAPADVPDDLVRVILEARRSQRAGPGDE